jgi:hypothetical protein
MNGARALCLNKAKPDGTLNSEMRNPGRCAPGKNAVVMLLVCKRNNVLRA